MAKTKKDFNDNTKFFHFNNSMSDDFIKIFGRENIIYFCCGGMGIKYYNTDRNNNLILEFSELIKNNEYTCCSCLNENYLLTNCKHNFCMSCQNNWKPKTCPICRKKL
jgi:hypothetical protein